MWDRENHIAVSLDVSDPMENCKKIRKLCHTAIVKNGKEGSFISHGMINGELSVYERSVSERVLYIRLCLLRGVVATEILLSD